MEPVVLILFFFVPSNCAIVRDFRADGKICSGHYLYYDTVFRPCLLGRLADAERQGLPTPFAIRKRDGNDAKRHLGSTARRAL